MEYLITTTDSHYRTMILKILERYGRINELPNDQFTFEPHSSEIKKIIKKPSFRNGFFLKRRVTEFLKNLEGIINVNNLEVPLVSEI